ncbi:DUF5682 family protein [Myceligenerans pegani]|uniref:Uncharacterized protein n=1 Tax=Myceligenerans pegani TaxID=2776917 RepID=A0ABR9MS35_9MICO|nr:DUF5682 family protein [Myceligenerans sp. TRM 65318]MBE1874189.1 hypothetical protein [Myceligenerans sp. TRM 65318]MBE3016461.1 hypothetical protein [Myceligenerans sp. TRM 65318]
MTTDTQGPRARAAIAGTNATEGRRIGPDGAGLDGAELDRAELDRADVTGTDATADAAAPERGLRAVWELAPDRLRRAAAAVEELRERGVHLAPVRHHSPACAVAVRRAIEELRPATVLIEGPEEYTRLLPELLHEDTRPPVALLSLPEGHGSPGGASFYPLASFSPEWVALRTASETGAVIRFCDRPSAERDRPTTAPATAVAPGDGGIPAPTAERHDAPDPAPAVGPDGGPAIGPETPAEHDPFARTLMSERYLAHSRSVAALARRLGCRDHDELWDHLFETRSPAGLADWRTTFDDVFAWAALSRLDYEDEVLAADGSLDREARMSARAAEAAGPVLVVTGAFHTLAIAEALAGLPEGEPVRGRWPEGGYGPQATGDAWLIRYDHERLDGLRGYGAGMPSPGFYERLHAAGGPGIATQVLVDVARAAGERGHQVSTPQVAAAAVAASRLADLRMRPHPGRTDVLDAITSCFVTDDGGIGPERPLGLAIAEVFGGREVGRVPSGAAVPPLVRDARERVRAVGLDIDATVPRTARLDARRTPAHRARRQVLALLDLLDCGFGRQVTGPDHVAGRGLGLIGEEWEYCWTPVVEARLVELSHLGATVEAAAVTVLRQAEEGLREAGAQAAADGAATLVARAAVVGLTAHLPRLVDLLARTLDTDRDLGSVVAGARRLLGLWRSRVELGLVAAPDGPDDTTWDERPASALPGGTTRPDEPGGRSPADELLALVAQALATAAYLVADVGRVGPDDEEAAVASVLELRALARDANRAWGGDDAARPPTGHGPGVRNVAAGQEPASAVARELARLRDDEGAAPAVRGALLAVGAVDGDVPDDVLVARVRGALRPGADPALAVRFLGGVLRAAPDLLLHTPELFDAVDGAIRDLTPDAFLAVLPDLRRGFTWLRPTETHRLAERVAERTGSRAADVDVRVRIDENDLAAGLAVERELAAVLARDGLAHWSGGHS